MSVICSASKVTTQFPSNNLIAGYGDELTQSELDEIVSYTIQKINNYPKSFGKTVENYFDILFPDEVKGHLIRRAINKKSAEQNHKMNRRDIKHVGFSNASK